MEFIAAEDWLVASGVAAVPPSRQLPSANPVSILFLEDDHRDFELAIARLHTCGVPFKAHRVETRDAFLRALEKLSFDLVLADYSLPSFDGLSALTLLRERDPDVPFIFVSGKLGEEVAINAIHNGATDYVLKQRMERLAPAVTRALREVDDRAERKRLQRELRVAEERLRVAQQAAGAGAWEWNVLTNQVVWSPEYYAVYGLDPQRTPPAYESWKSCVIEEDRQRAEQEVMDVVRQKQDTLWSEFRIHRYGELRWLAAVGRAVEHANGQPTRLAGVTVDITARKQAEQALHERDQLLRAMYTQAPVGISEADLEGRFTEVNPKYCEITGYTREELIGKAIVDITHPDDAASNLNRYRSLNPEDGPSYTVEKRYIRKDGSTIWASVTVAKVCDNARNPKYGIAFVQDITHRKQVEAAVMRQAAELERSNADLQQFAYVAGHDLQEPLRTINAYSQLLARRVHAKLQPDEIELIGFMGSAAQRMQTLISSLLSYAQLVNKESSHADAVEMEAVVRMTVLNLEALISESGATVTFDELPTVVADEIQITQLLQNLIGNAIKYHGEQPPKVHISAERRPGELVFSVRDNGVGVPMQHRERVFGVFKRLHGSDVPGAGVGLAICRRIIEKHGGRIWVEGEYGQGATFRFTLPER